MKTILIILCSFAVGALLTYAYFTYKPVKNEFPTGGACKIEITQHD